MLIKCGIKGSNDSGRIEWTGEVDLEIDAEWNVTGKIEWRGHGDRGGIYNGVETVKGKLKGDDLSLQGKSKTGNIVLCTYSGTWRNGQIDLSWPPHRPRYSGGRVSSQAYR